MIDFSCKLVDHGWIEVILTTETDELKIEPSFLSDAPCSLIMALTSLLEGQSEAVCEWQDEPGEYRWIFTRKKDSFELGIYYFKETFSRRENKYGDRIFFDEEVSLKFARKVLREFGRIKREYTASEYEDLWGYGFPQKEIDRLRMALKNAKAFDKNQK